MSGCERGSCSPQNTEIKDPRASLDSWSPGLRAVAALSKTVCPSSTSALLPRPQLTRGSTLYTGTQKPHPANLRVCSKLIHRRVPAPQGPELASCPLPPPQSLQNLSSFSLLGQLAHFGSRLSPSLLPRCLTARRESWLCGALHCRGGHGEDWVPGSGSLACRTGAPVLGWNARARHCPATRNCSVQMGDCVSEGKEEEEVPHGPPFSATPTLAYTIFSERSRRTCSVART